MDVEPIDKEVRDPDRAKAIGKGAGQEGGQHTGAICYGNKGADQGRLYTDVGCGHRCDDSNAEHHQRHHNLEAGRRHQRRNRTPICQFCHGNKLCNLIIQAALVPIANINYKQIHRRTV